MIRPATVHDVARVKKITEACAAHMCAQGIYQWNAHYPSEAVFKKDVEEGSLYVFELVDEVVGCIMCSTYKDELYNSIDWQSPEGHNLYIHRLAVHPDFQGRGIAQQLMDFAENKAIALHCHSVRLDTFSQNPRNNRFYQTRGYQKLGDVYFPKQSEHPFHCYEKVLEP